MDRFTEAQWTRLNTLLDEQEARTQRQLVTLRAATQPASREAPVEHATLAEQDAGDQTHDIMLVHYRNELAQVDAARQRMQERQYGICVDCGEAIPFLRLQAQPTALRCLSCQALRERKWG